jgi:hypothetical protein
MPLHTIHHACGHSRDIELKGKPERHPERAAKLAGENCPACRWDEHHEHVVTLSGGLPALEGSEKQIKWAMSLRVDALLWVLKALDLEASQNETMQQALHDYRRHLLRQTEARWWINVREQMQRGCYQHFRGFFIERKRFYGPYHLLLTDFQSEWSYHEAHQIHGRHF